MKQKAGPAIRRGLNLLAALSILCSLLPVSVAAAPPLEPASPPAATQANTAPSAPEGDGAPTTPPAGGDGHRAAHGDETAVSLSYLTERDVQRANVGPGPGAPEALALAGPTRPSEIAGPWPPVAAAPLKRTPSLLADPPEWGPNMQLSPRRDVWAPAIAFDDAGHAHVVWEQDEFHIVYVRRTAGSRYWSRPIFQHHPELIQWYPDVAVDSGANPDVHIVWRGDQGSDENVYYARLEHGNLSFDAAEQVSTSGEAIVAPAVAVEANGNIHVTWTEYNPDSQVYRICYRAKGSSWGSIECKSGKFNSYRPAIAADAAGNVYVIYKEFYGYEPDEVYRIVCSKISGGGLGEPTAISGYAPSASVGNVAVDGSDHLHVVWHSTQYVYYRELENGCQGSSPTVQLDDTSLLSMYPSVATDEDGNVYAVWAQSPDPDQGVEDIYAAYRLADESDWSVPVRVSDDRDLIRYMPDIAADSTSNAYAQAVWHSYYSPYHTIDSSILGMTTTSQVALDLTVIAPSELITGGQPITYIPNPMLITAVVTNTGSISLEVEAELSPPLGIEPDEGEWQYVGYLEPGQSEEVTWSVFIPAQPYDVWAPYCVETMQASKQLNEWPKVCKEVFIPGLGPGPDLVVADTLVTPTKILVGQPLPITATIKNVGDEEAGASLASLEIETPDGVRWPTLYWPVDSLETDEVYTVTGIITLTRPGVHRLWFRADVTQTVTETNERNNESEPVEVEAIAGADECDAECPLCNDSQRRHKVGGPVDTLTGSYSYRTTDLSIPTRGLPLHFERTYNSTKVTNTTVYSRPLGYGWTHNYDVRLVFADDSGGEPGTVVLKAFHGSRLRFVDNDDGTYEAYPGLWASLVRVPAGGSTYTYTVTASSDETLTFDDDGRLTIHTDPWGNRTTLTYNSDTLTRITGPSGQRWLDLSYNGLGWLKKVEDHTGREVGYGYDGGNNLTVVTDTLEQAWTYTYTGTHLLYEAKEPGGRVVERTHYDDEGRAVRQENGADETVVEIDYVSELGRVVVGAGRTINDVYSDRGVLVSQTDVEENLWIYTFDESFNRTSVIDPNGNPTYLEYEDDCGCRPTSITDALNNETTMDYDGPNLTLHTDALERETTYYYEDNNLIRITYPGDNGTTEYTYDNYGQVTSVTDAEGRTTYYNYDELGQQTAITDALGTITSYEYDELGRLEVTTVAASTPLAKVTVNEYDDAGRLVKVTGNYLAGQPPGHRDEYNLITEYEYDPVGHLLTTTVAAGTSLAKVIVNEYDDASRLVKVTGNYLAGQPPGYQNEYNLVTEYSYDAAGRPETTTVLAGTTLARTTRHEYDELGYLEKITENVWQGKGQNYQNEYNLVTTYEYDAAGNQIKVTNTLGQVTEYEYDELNRTKKIIVNVENGPDLITEHGYDGVGNQTWVTDTRGIRTKYEYDDLDQAKKVTVNYDDGSYDAGDPDKDVYTSYQYDNAGNQTHVVDTLGRSTAYGYDELNRVVTITNALNGTTVYAYDHLGHRTRTTDARDNDTYYGYDSLGRLITITNALESTTIYDYDLLSNRTSVTDAEKNTADYEYDNLSRLTKATDAEENDTEYDYDAAGNRVRITDARDNATEYGYDSLGRLKAITNTMGFAITYAYDALNNRTTATDPLGHTTTFAYDELNRVTSVTDAEANTKSYAYDDANNYTSVVDAEGVVTRYEYDDLNRLVKVTGNYVAGAGSTATTNVVTEYGYDGAGNHTSVVDARGSTTTYEYDALDQLKSATDPLEPTTSYKYDAVGNRVVMTDANGVAINYQYDELDRLTVISYPDSDVEYGYDAVGNRTAMTDTTGTTIYVYDNVYRLNSVTDWHDQTVGYGYDGVGNRTVITYPGSLVMTYEYDDLNRLETVTDWDAGMTDYTYDAVSRLTGVSRPNGTTTSYDFDDANRVIELAHYDGVDLLARYTYKLDGVGNRLATTETVHYPMAGMATLPSGMARASDAPLDAEAVATTELPPWLASPGQTEEEKETLVPVFTPTPPDIAVLPAGAEPPSLAFVGPVFPDAGLPAPAPLLTPTHLISTTLLPSVEQVLAASDGGLTLTVPVSAVFTPTRLVVAYADPALVVLPEGWTEARLVYQFDGDLSFAVPITAVLSYAGEPTDTLAVHAWYAGAWHALATVVDPTTRLATTAVDRVERLALLVETVPPDRPTPTPTLTPTLTPAMTPMPSPTPTLTPTMTATPAPTMILPPTSTTTSTPLPPTPTLEALPLPPESVKPGLPARADARLARTSLPADGRTQTRLVVLVTDELGQPVADGTQVSLSAVGAQVSPGSARTVDGLVFARLRAGKQAGAGQVKVRAGSATAEVSFELAALTAGEVRADDGTVPEDAPLPFDLAEVVERSRNTIRVPQRGQPFVEREGHRALFDAGSLHFVPLDGGNARLTGEGDLPVPLTMTVELAGVYVGAQPLFEGPAPATVELEGNVARFRRGRGLVEECVARDAGVEQRWRLEEEPGLKGDLVVAVEVESALILGPAGGGTGFVFRAVDEKQGAMTPVAGYGRALVLDADGRAKRAQLQSKEVRPVQPGQHRYRLEMTVDAEWLAAARYPVVVDPLVGSLLRLDAASTQGGDQAKPAVAYNSSNWEYLVVWQDDREGDDDVYGQFVLPDGLLAGENFTITTTSGDQTAPDVAYNPDDDEYLVVWGHNTQAIKGRIVGASGILSPELTLDSTMFPAPMDYPAVIYSDAAGRWLVTWQRWASSNGYDVKARAVDGSGGMETAYTVCSDSYDDTLPDVAANDDQGFLVTWERSLSDSTPNYDIYARRVTTTGVDGSAFAVSSAAGSQVAPRVVYDGNDDEYLVVWQDLNSYDTIRGQRVDGDNGQLIGTAFVVSDASQVDCGTPAVTYYAPSGESDGIYLVAWEQQNRGETDLRIRRVLTDGTPSGASFTLCDADEDQTDVALGFGPAVIETLAAWTDERAGDQDVHARVVERDGDLGGDLMVHPAPGDQQLPEVAYNSDDDEYLVVWEDYRHGAANTDIYAQRVLSDGVLVGANITVSHAFHRQLAPKVAYAADGDVYLVAWKHHPGTSLIRFNVYGQLLSRSGTLTGDPLIVASHSSGADRESPGDIVYNDTANKFLVLYQDAHDGAWNIWGRHVSVTGTMETPIQVTFQDNEPEVVATGAYNPDDDQYLIAYQYRPASSPTDDVLARRMSGDGTVTATETISVATGSADQQNPDVVYLGEVGRYAVVWEEASSSFDVYGRLVSPAGALDGSNYLVGGETVSERYPRLGLDGAGGALVVWYQDKAGSTADDLYGRRLGSDGRPSGPGFTLLETVEQQQMPAVAGNGAGRYLLAWQDERNGDWDIYASLFQPLRAGFAALPTVGTVPLDVAFADWATPDGAVDEWLWSLGDGVTSTLASPVHTYTVPGVYTVTQWVTDTDSGEADVLTRTQYVTVTPGEVIITYDYDPLYRLITATYSSGEVFTYTYDAVGNRLKMGANGEVTGYTYNEANRLTSVGDVSYTWDNNGNLLADGVRTYNYDYANRLVQVVSGTLTTTFTYDGDGHRVAKVENGQTTTYTVSVLGLSHVLVESTDGQRILYLYGHDLLAEKDGSAWTWHLGDGLGSVRQLADSNGQVTLAQGYTPFGVLLWRAGSDGTGYGFTGERWEAGNGLLYLRTRYYDPATGRFFGPDPFPGFAHHPATLHGYDYAANNPVSHTDPTGCQGGAGALAGGGAVGICWGVAFLIPDPFFIEEGICLLFTLGVIAAVTIPIAVQVLVDEDIKLPQPRAPQPTYPPGRPVPMPAPAPAPPLPVPEDGYVSPQEAAELRKFIYGDPGPDPTGTPRPHPDPHPAPDPVSSPCPTKTRKPKEKHIALGLTVATEEINGEKQLVDSVLMFNERLNERLNPQGIFVYTWHKWYDAHLTNVPPQIPELFGLAFTEASENAKRIHFNLRGISDPLDFMEKEGSAGKFRPGSSYTADELYVIRERSDELCDKTKFYKDGYTVSMSAWMEICSKPGKDEQPGK